VRARHDPALVVAIGCELAGASAEAIDESVVSDEARGREQPEVSDDEAMPAHACVIVLNSLG
jgi:hypothetical protein